MVALLAIGFALPVEAQTEVPRPPPGYETSAYTSSIGVSTPRLMPVERTSTIRGLWLPGLIVLPVAWLTTMTISSSAFEGDAASYAWIPVVGPWLMLTQDLNGNDAGVIVSGIVQGLSTLAIILGLSIKRTWIEQEYVIDENSGARLRFGWNGVQIQL